MVFKAGRWKQLSMTERWLILNGLATIQQKRRSQRAQKPTVARLRVYRQV